MLPVIGHQKIEMSVQIGRTLANGISTETLQGTKGAKLPGKAGGWVRPGAHGRGFPGRAGRSRPRPGPRCPGGLSRCRCGPSESRQRAPPVAKGRRRRKVIDPRRAGGAGRAGGRGARARLFPVGMAGEGGLSGGVVSNSAWCRRLRAAGMTGGGHWERWECRPDCCCLESVFGC